MIPLVYKFKKTINRFEFVTNVCHLTFFSLPPKTAKNIVCPIYKLFQHNKSSYTHSYFFSSFSALHMRIHLSRPPATASASECASQYHD